MGLCHWGLVFTKAMKLPSRGCKNGSFSSQSVDDFGSPNTTPHLGGGFKYFVFTPILGEMIQPVMGLWGSFYAEKSALQNRKTAGDSKECERDDRQGGAACWMPLAVMD